MILPIGTSPLTTCIMATYNRRAFVPQAIEYFLRQDYANKELVIVGDGNDAISDLVLLDERIRYICLGEENTVEGKHIYPVSKDVSISVWNACGTLERYLIVIKRNNFNHKYF